MTDSTRRPIAQRMWQPVPGPLHAEVLASGSSSLTPLVLLHGFTQTRRSWDPLLDVLVSVVGPARPIVRIDLPGHGGSSDVVANLPDTADLVIETCGSGIFCGYSMGGRVALHIALQHPRLVTALITIGATAGISDPDERHHRRSADDDLADSIESIGTRAFIEQWLAQPMFSRLPNDPVDVLERTSNSASGLAMSLRRAGTGTQEPLWQRLHELTMPVLLLAGHEDEKFSAIGADMAREIGDNASFVSIPDAGHSAHLENPLRVADEIGAFLMMLR